MSTKQSPKTLIVYSHDSSEHIDRVARLADKLAEEGVEAYLDRHFVAPAYGWAVWMQWMIRNMDFVLVVCTEHYHLRTVDVGNPFSGASAPGGRGVPFEFVLICNHIYCNSSRNDRFIPVVFDQRDQTYIPVILAAHSGYVVSDLSLCPELLSRLRGGGLRRARRHDVKSDGAASSEVAVDLLIGFAPGETSLAKDLARDLSERNVTYQLYLWDRKGCPPAHATRGIVLLVGTEGFGPFGAAAPCDGWNTNGAAHVHTVIVVWVVPSTDHPALPHDLRVDHQLDHAAGADVGALAGQVHDLIGRPAAGRPIPPRDLLADIGWNLLDRRDNDCFLVYDSQGKSRRLAWTLPTKIPKPGKETSPGRGALDWKRLHSAAEVFYRNAFLDLRLFAERARHAPDYLRQETYVREAADFLCKVLPQFQQYAIELETMPKWLKKTDVHRQLMEILHCRGVLLQSLSSPPGSRSLENGLCLIEQMAHWLLDALHMADQSLFVYLEDAKS